jgi:hypothetical protein
MIRALIPSGLALFALGALAQTDATVSGRIVDAATGEPVPFATIRVQFAEGAEQAALDSTETGTIADEEGLFIVSGLPQGRFVFSASLLGYATTDVPVLVGELNDIYNLGEIELAARPDDALEEVVATARQELLGASLDRRVFSLDDALAQSGGSLLDAMRALPGVTVDQEGRLLLRGSDRVSVLVDGKQSGLTGYGNQAGLDTISASTIESIEIINNPSSRYDASGMAGIINIVYRDSEEQGLNVNAGLTLGVGQLSRRRADLPTDLGSFDKNPRLNPSVNLTYNSPDIRYNFLADVLVQDDIPNNEFTTRFYDDGTVILSQVPENREQEHFIFGGGLDKQLDDLRTLSFSSLIDFETHRDVAQVPFIDAATMERTRYWFWREEEDTGHFNVALNYERRFDEPGHQISMNLQYTRGWEDEAYFLNEESPVRVGTDATHLDAEEHTLPFQIDYIRPLRSGRIEAGAKLQRRWIPVTYDVERGVGSVIYAGLGDWSEWGEDISAVYASYVHERERLDIEAGVRLEQTDVTYDLPSENVYYQENDAYDYFEVYPNIRVTYHVDALNSLAFHYNNRVDRPGEPELRIFPKYDDPELLKVGNPYLRPQFTESFEIGYERLWDTGNVVASVYLRNIDDPFLRVYAIDATNPNYDIINKIYQNVGGATHTGVEVIVAQDIGRSWELSGSVNWYDNVIDAADTMLLFPVQRPFSVPETQETTWDLKLTSLFQAPNGFRLQASIVYYDERNIPQGREAARYSLDLGVSKPVLDERAEVVLNVTDLFNEFGTKQTIDGEGFDAVYENFFQTQVVSLGFTYDF